ncbi:MAG: hypothetical protein EP314_05365, partial [Bacteroidetes bacterium]
MRFSNIWPFIFVLTMLAGCSRDPLDVDVSDIEPEIHFHRLDRELFNLDPTAGSTQTAELVAKYGDFFSAYTNGVLRLGDPSSEALPYAVAQFIT